MSTTPNQIFQAYQEIEDGYTLKTKRPIINFISGATIVDNPSNNSTDITISGGGGTFATTYSNSSTANNTITEGNTGKGLTFKANSNGDDIINFRDNSNNLVSTIDSSGAFNGNVFASGIVQTDLLAPFTSLSIAGTTTINQTATSSGAPGNTLEINPGAHTNITASTLTYGLKLDSKTWQWLTGNMTTLGYAALFHPTYAFTGASTITNAATLYIDKAPVAGTQATITNSFALYVDDASSTSRFEGVVYVGDTLHATTVDAGTLDASAITMTSTTGPITNSTGTSFVNVRNDNSITMGGSSSNFLGVNYNIFGWEFNYNSVRPLELNATSARPGADNTISCGISSQRWSDGYFGGTVKSNHFVSTANTMTLTLNATMLGTTTSTSVTGTDHGGYVAFTTGTVAGVPDGYMFKVTYTTPFPNGSSVAIFPADTATTGTGGTAPTGILFNGFTDNNVRWVQGTTTGFTFYFYGSGGTGGLVNSTAYRFSYVVSGY